MKALLILLVGIAYTSGAPSPAKEADHVVEKRSPDDVYLFYPFQSSTSRFRTSGRPSSTFGGAWTSRTSRQRPLGYFIDYDDLYDDRRKRQASPTSRQKRAADFDDDFFWFPRTPSFRTWAPRTSFVRPTGRFFIDYDDLFDDRRKRQITPADAKRQKRDVDFDDDFFWFPRTSSFRTWAPRTTFVRPTGRFFYDFDDLFDDRRKRQITPSDAKRQKRDVDFDDDDHFVYYTSPVTYSVAPTVSQSVPVGRTTPVQTVYYSVDDDDDHDRKKRSAKPDDDDDDYHIVYSYTRPRTVVQTRSFVQPRPTVYSPLTYVTYDFDDKK